MLQNDLKELEELYDQYNDEAGKVSKEREMMENEIEDKIRIFE